MFLSLVGQYPFHGLRHEQPMAHIEMIEELASEINCNEISKDSLS